jgi:DNA-binding transcriptional ArsR family regulator
MVSRHLGVLRTAGVVTVRRDGSWIHYRLREQESPEVERQLASLVDTFAERRALAREVAKLKNAVGPGACK